VALTKTIFPSVPLFSFDHVSQTIQGALSTTATSGITITCSDAGVKLTVVSHPAPKQVYIRRYEYEWHGRAMEVKTRGSEDLERLRGDAHGGSPGVSAEAEAAWDPTPEELAAFAQEEDEGEVVPLRNDIPESVK